jgi:phenylacetate-CoA ligase
MLILLGVNVFPSSLREVVSGFYPRTTGEIQILLEKPGPRVEPPLTILTESSAAPAAEAELKSEIERKIRAVLSVAANVELVPAGTLPRYEMKGQLVKHLYHNQAQDSGRGGQVRVYR